MEMVPAREPTPDEFQAALTALTERDRFRAAEQRVARFAPELQQVLAHALREGGWFDEAHESQILKAATTPDEDERLTAVRTLVAEETRLGMLVGAAVGFELAREPEAGDPNNDREEP